MVYMAHLMLFGFSKVNVNSCIPSLAEVEVVITAVITNYYYSTLYNIIYNTLTILYTLLHHTHTHNNN